MKNFTNKQKTIIIVILIIISVAYYIYKTNEEKNIQESINELIETNNKTENTIETNEESNNETKESSQDTENKILIHITGAIKKEGVYELTEGDRIIDAINKAEGVTEEADTSQINMASKLEDVMKIYVPKKGENTTNIQSQEEQIENIQIKSENNNNKNSSSKKININTASMDELDTLPGIGEATAQKIIDYRKEKGKFSKIEDLKEVSGIGESKYEKIKDKICV